MDRLMTSDPQDWCAFSSCLRPAPPEPSGGSAASHYERYADKVVAMDRNHERVVAPHELLEHYRSDPAWFLGGR